MLPGLRLSHGLHRDVHAKRERVNGSAIMGSPIHVAGVLRAIVPAGSHVYMHARHTCMLAKSCLDQ